MKNDPTIKHKLNTADIITFFRIGGTLLLIFLRPFSAAFFCVYTLTGLTDVLDGWIARKTKTASDFGARIDSIADLLFYTVVLIRLFPYLRKMIPIQVWYAVVGILILRLIAYCTAAIKYHRFASLHTLLNKLTGMAVFMLPYIFAISSGVVYSRVVCVLAYAASFEELAIHLLGKKYRADTKSIFQKKP